MNDHGLRLRTLCAVALAVLGVGGTGLATEPAAPAPPTPPRAAPAPAAPDAFDLDWWSVDGGGATSSGGDFSVTGTVGQPDASLAAAGGVVADGGLWSGLRSTVFSDGFELGDATRWSSGSP